MNNRFLDFGRLAIRRLRSRFGLTMLSLLGVILAIGMVTSIPVFSQGVAYLVLREELTELQAITNRPPFGIRLYFVSSVSQPLAMDGVWQMQNILTNLLQENVGLPARDAVTYVQSPSVSLLPPGTTREEMAQARGKSVSFSAFSELSNQLFVLDGAPYPEYDRSGDRIPVWAHEKLANEIGLNPGEEYDLLDSRTGRLLPVVIAGIWLPSNEENARWYWHNSDSLLVTPEDYASRLQGNFAELTGFVSWYFNLDDTRLTIDTADRAANGLERVPVVAAATLSGTRMDVSPLARLQNYVQRKTTLSVLLIGFSLPVLCLLLYFLSLISTVTVQFQREETAILASRGAGRAQILGLAALETLILIGVGAPLGLLAGMGLARLMGNTLSFLTFVQRPALPASLWATDVRLLGVALLMLMVARLWPAFQASGESVVTHLRGRSRQIASGALGKLAIDIPLIVASVYAYQQLKQRGTIGILDWEAVNDPFSDPLLLLAPSLFVFTAALVMSHLFPLVVRPMDASSERVGSFASYLGLRRLARQSNQYATALFLVIVCLSLGAFYASMAGSLDRWLKERIYYATGAEYTFRLMSQFKDDQMTLDPNGAWLLPISDYQQLPEVQNAARVGEFEITSKNARVVGKPHMLAVDRVDFTQVAYFRDDFADVALGELMNRLGMFNNGILVSKDFLERNNLAEGQQLTLDVKVGSNIQYAWQTIEFLIVGSYDYFPTLLPDKGDVFVGNLDYVFDLAGDLYPHDIWIDLKPGASRESLAAELTAMAVAVGMTQDTQHLIMADEDRVERIGLFGVLSIGFLTSAVLACVGLLVYTYASLQGRLQQLSVLRAIGVQTSEVLTMERIEYAGVIVYGIISGAVVGIVTSQLFVPFFQFSSDPGVAVPPFLPTTAWGRIGLIALVFALALALSQLVILYGATRREIFQTLRMGQRE